MKKKAIIMLGIVSIGVSCNETTTSEALMLSGAGRVVSVDSTNDRVVVDTTTKAVTRNVHARPELQITGLFSRRMRPQKGDILFFTIDSTTSLSQEKKLESFRLFSYHAN